MAFGLHKAAKYYYYPGWHEPGSTLECFINKKAFNALSKDLQSIVLTACKAANLDMLSEFTARNNQALQQLVNQHNVQVKALPDDVLIKLRTLSEEVVSEMVEREPMARKIYESFDQFRRQVIEWEKVSEQAYLRARSL